MCIQSRCGANWIARGGPFDKWISDRGIRLTPSHVLPEPVMRQVVAQVQGTSFVYQGAGALAIACGLNRYSTDLDFDADRGTDSTRRSRRAMQTAGLQ